MLNIRIKTDLHSTPHCIWLFFLYLSSVYTHVPCSLGLHEENVLITLFPGRPGSLLSVSRSSVEWVLLVHPLCPPQSLSLEPCFIFFMFQRQKFHVYPLFLILHGDYFRFCVCTLLYFRSFYSTCHTWCSLVKCFFSES